MSLSKKEGLRALSDLASRTVSTDAIVTSLWVMCVLHFTARSPRMALCLRGFVPEIRMLFQRIRGKKTHGYNDLPKGHGGNGARGHRRWLFFWFQYPASFRGVPYPISFFMNGVKITIKVKTKELHEMFVWPREHVLRSKDKIFTDFTEHEGFIMDRELIQWGP